MKEMNLTVSRRHGWRVVSIMLLTILEAYAHGSKTVTFTIYGD